MLNLTPHGLVFGDRVFGRLLAEVSKMGSNDDINVQESKERPGEDNTRKRAFSKMAP